MSRFKDMLGDEIYPLGPGHRGVATSVAAAESIRPHLSHQQSRIMDFLRGRKAHGATYDEICDGTQLSAPSVCGRMKELVSISPPQVVVARFTRPTKSGRAAQVYVAREFANDSASQS